MKPAIIVSPAEANAVAEVLGVDGPFSFPEKLFQHIWARREFDQRGARTVDGRELKILHPGRWNHLGGPDFLGARLVLAGQVVAGDIELHLRAPDWDAHAHAINPAYNNVILHVVLFPPTASFSDGAGNRQIPLFSLLPRLYHDLEEYAANAAIEVLANRPSARLFDPLGRLPLDELRALLQRHAHARWTLKVRFAGIRITQLGWVEACHHAALEILGYRSNRTPMLRLASAHPLEAWLGGGVNSDKLYALENDGWSLQGVRPANHPQIRLRQYAAWTAATPDWPQRLRAAMKELPVLAGVDEARPTTRAIRKAGGFAVCRETWRQALGGGAIGGNRWDTLVCDGFLPLAAADSVDRTGELGTWWHHWYPGDLPALIRPGLRDLGLTTGPGDPACHGFGQGVLGWWLEHDVSS